ncbi:MAG: hypothetical protein LC793_15335 [Thermomicrobia bacterium]|nr:hypothetical protein [Thermomicrobia bacterium]
MAQWQVIGDTIFDGDCAVVSEANNPGLWATFGVIARASEADLADIAMMVAGRRASDEDRKERESAITPEQAAAFVTALCEETLKHYDRTEIRSVPLTIQWQEPRATPPHC